jgi:Zn-dependent protease with chaperone function
MSALYGFWHGMLVHLWQTTLVLGVIFIIDKALRNAPSGARHALWSMALLKLFLPLPLLGPLTGELLRRAAGGSAVHGGASFLLPPVLVAVLDPLSGSGASRGFLVSWAPIAATLCWGAIVLYLTLRGFLGAVRAGRIEAPAASPLDGRQSRRLAVILDDAGIASESVIIRRGFTMPAVAGILRPRIIIPECLVSELPDDALRAVLVHEEAHRRRRDPLRAAVRRLSVALFFFYPPLYLVLARLRATAEFACDENVVRSGISADAYARALARTLELGLSSPAFAAAAAAGGSLLRQRLKRLATLDPRRYTMRMHYRVLIALAIVLVAGAALLPSPKAARPGDGASPAAAIQQKPDTAKAAGHSFDQAPQIVTTANPAYPEQARKLGVETTLLMTVTINETGKVIKVKTLQTPELVAKPEQKLTADQTKKLSQLFVKSAVEALKAWKFEPAQLKGKPVTAEVAIPVKFKLQ